MMRCVVDGCDDAYRWWYQLSINLPYIVDRTWMFCCHDDLHVIPKQHVCAASIDVALFNPELLDDLASQTWQIRPIYVTRLQLGGAQQV